MPIGIKGGMGTLGSLYGGGRGESSGFKASPTGSPGSLGGGAFGGMSSPTSGNRIGEASWRGGFGTPGLAGGFGNAGGTGAFNVPDRAYQSPALQRPMPWAAPMPSMGGTPPPMQILQPDIVRNEGPSAPMPVYRSPAGVPSFEPAPGPEMPPSVYTGPLAPGFQPDIVRSLPADGLTPADAPPFGALGDVYGGFGGVGDGMEPASEFLPMSERRRAPGRMA